MLPLNSTHIPFDSCPSSSSEHCLVLLSHSVTPIHCPPQSWRLEFKTKYKMCSNRSMAKEWHLCLLSAAIMCLFKLQFPCLLSHYHLAVKQCLLDLCMEVWTECLLLFLSGDPQSSLGVYIEEEAQAQPAFQLAKPLSPKQTALHTSPLASFLEGTTSLFFLYHLELSCICSNDSHITNIGVCLVSCMTLSLLLHQDTLIKYAPCDFWALWWRVGRHR